MNISKESIKAVEDLKPGYVLGQADTMIIKKMARYILELQKQEPAAVLERRNDGTDKLIIDAVPPGRYELFLAPPITNASQVPPAVPDEISYQESKELFNYLMTEEELNATVNGWNACRGAMLQLSGNTYPTEQS